MSMDYRIEAKPHVEAPTREAIEIQKQRQFKALNELRRRIRQADRKGDAIAGPMVLAGQQ